MYNMTKKQIANLVRANTPIDTIISTKELYNGFEVKGMSNNKIVSYNFYENGKVTENE